MEFYVPLLYFNQTNYVIYNVSSVTPLGLTLCDPTDCSTPGLLVHHHLPELAQTHIH